MANSTETEKLHIRLIQPTDYFISNTFNDILKDIDNKVVGVSHLDSVMHWQEWKESTEYSVNDIVRWEGMKSHQYAKCITGGISDEESPGNNVTGSELVDNTVEWKVLSLTESTDSAGTIMIWLAGGKYSRGDVVLYASSLYRARVTHESLGSFELDKSNWQEIYSSIRKWELSKYYYAGDTVIVDNIIYKCNTEHTSGLIFRDSAEFVYWDIVGSISLVESWDSEVYYNTNQLVSYNGVLYRCNSTHKSTTDFISDISNWDVVYSSIPLWATNTVYVEGNVVCYDNVLYRCIVTHESSVFTADSENWVKVSGSGLETWVTNHEYSVGDIVIYNNKIYSCTTAHTSSAAFVDDESKWQEISACITRIPNWETDTDYVVGDLVSYDKKIFRCTVAHTSDPVEWNDTEKANWEELSPTINEISDWATSTDYEVGQLVIHDNRLYRCTTDHSSTTFKDDISYWQTISSSGVNDWQASVDYNINDLVVVTNINGIDLWKPSVQYSVNDKVYTNGYIYKCITANNDSAFDKNKWTIVEPVSTNLYRCIELNNDSTFDESKWQLLNGDSKALEQDVLNLLA